MTLVRTAVAIPFSFLPCPQVRCMKLVQHPNVVRLYEVIDTQTKLYLILELGDGGDLYDYIMRHDSGLSEEVKKNVAIVSSYCTVMILSRRENKVVLRDGLHGEFLQ